MVLTAAALVMGTVAVAPAYAADAWTAQPSWNPPTASAGYAKPTLGDLNGDGLLDLMIGDKNGVVHAYLNTGSATAPVWTANAALDVNTGGTYAAPSLVDINGDGKLDLMVGGGSSVRGYQNTGTTSAPVWTRTTAWDLTGLQSSQKYAPSFADLNGDGLVDMVLGQQGGNLTAYQNTGGPGGPIWTAQPAWSPSPLYDAASNSSPVMAKLDAGSTYDMLFGDQLGTIFALQNTGSATSPQWTSIGEWYLGDINTAANDYASPAVGDLDGDGQPDLLYGDLSGAVYAYKNNGLPPPGQGTGTPVLPPDLTTVHERFDGFTCTGAWLPAAGPNSSYARDCGNGWTAYAEDVANPGLSSPPPGGIGNQSVVTADGVNGPSDTAAPASAAEIYTAPTDSVRGVLWLLKTYAVRPGQFIDTLTADFRDQVDAAYDTYAGIVVFDGTVTDPSGLSVAGVPQRSDVLASNIVREGGNACGANTWCAWHTVNLGDHVLPTKSTITIALRIGDTGTIYNVFAELDNVTVSGVATPAVSSVPVGDIAQLWTTSYTAAGDHNMAHPADVAVDASGNIYLVGSTYNGLNYDILTAKYDSTGSQLWQKTYDGGDSDEGVGIAVDGSGNVYVSGRTWNSSNNDFVAVKYDGGGNQQWATRVDNSSRDDIPIAQALDAAGNLYLTGSSCLVNSCDYLTAKIDSAGTVAWSVVYNGGTYDNAAGIALDGAGNTYVTGTSTGSTSDDIVTIKYDASGNQAWLDRFDSGTNDHAMAIASGDGHLYATGWDYKSGTPDIVLISFDTATGGEQWVKTYDSGAQDLPTALAVDGTGNVYLSGTVGTVGDHRIITAEYAPDGANVWLHTYGQSGYDSNAARIAVDAGGNAYVMGSVEHSSGNTDFVTLRYDASGTIQNAVTYDGYSVADTGVAIALGVDAQGDTVPIVAGTSTDTQGVQHIAVVRYEKARPDLIVSSLSGPSSFTAGDTISVTDTVQNLSDLANKIYASTGPFDVVFYLAPDVGGLPDTVNMAEIGFRTVSNLDPGQPSSASTSVTVPTSVTEGKYFLVAVADGHHAVTEANENNNLLTGEQITVTGTLPDLAVTDVSGPSSAARGDTVSITTSVSDLVSIAAGGFRVGIYLSSDTSITTGDTLIGSYSVTGLAGFATDTRTTSVTIPTGLSPGNYYLGVIADDQGAVTEANENNNTQLLRTGTSTSTRLVTSSDFIPGLAGSTNAAISGTGSSARVLLTHSIVWTTNAAWNAAASSGTRAKPALADLNNDGLLDLFIGSSTGIVYAYQNTGTASSPVWTAATAWNIPANGATMASPAFYDLDGDGMLDAVVGYRDYMRVYRNTGNNTAPVWTEMTAWEITGLTTNRFYAPALADMNGDGKVDLLMGTNLGGTILAYANTGSASSPAWTATSAWNLPTLSGAVSPRAADMDGNGTIDLMVGGPDGVIRGYSNTGTTTAPAWTANTAWNIPSSYSGSTTGLGLGDLNGDGSLDLVYGDLSGSVYGYQNTGVYAASGNYTSKVVDAGTHGGFTEMDYVSSVPNGTALTVDVRAGGSTTAGDGTWTPWLTNVANGGDISALGTLRYVQYRINFTSNGTQALSPSVYAIQALTQEAPPQPTVVSVVTGSGGGGSLAMWDLAVLAGAGLIGRRRSRRKAHH